jgi:hypothetical protein
MPEINPNLPHLIIPIKAQNERFKTPKKGGSGEVELPTREREAHAHKLIVQLEQLKLKERGLIDEQRAHGIETGGIQIEFLSDPGLTLKLESLEFQQRGIELCSTHQNDEGATTATVFIPEGKIDYFLKKIIDYKEKNTKPREDGTVSPKNQDLVESIADIKLAVLDALWTDGSALLPVNSNEAIWWEVWIRLSDTSDNMALFQEHARRLGLRLKDNTREIVKFIDRAIILAYGTKEVMARSILLLGVIAELRRAKEVGGFFTELTILDQREWVDDLFSRIQVNEDSDIYACLLDTGINHPHPLLALVADAGDMHSYEPVWGTHDGHRSGHGTPMAGLAIYGDLTDVLVSNRSVELNHRLESVKILPNSGSPPNDPSLYGAITRESISRVEIIPERKRVFCMAVSSDGRERGKPSSWSATVDNLTSGADDETQRLIILAAGDADPGYYVDYPCSNYTSSVQDPGQAWNALVVGGYTEKIHIEDPRLGGYLPLACSGDLAPSSCTSMTWDSKNWPFKPDIVMEAGNIGIDRALNFASCIDDLELISTHHDFNNKLLVNFRETSAATALATRLAAMVLVRYPSFWPETVRALIVHSAEWTGSMLKTFVMNKNLQKNKKNTYRPLLQCYGYGVPNEEKLFWSASNSLTLIAQDNLQPFFEINKEIETKDINFHRIPWPKETLEQLGNVIVEMKVTLSYFIEPNPGQRGWGTKYSYASHRLQFDVKRSLETLDAFKQRINKQARDEEFDSKNNAEESGHWILGSNLRKTGSIHSDTWIGTAAELASREYIGVYPLSGWWKELKKHQGWTKSARYSLIISLTTPETDIYTEIENQIKTLVEV